MKKIFLALFIGLLSLSAVFAQDAAKKEAPMQKKEMKMQKMDGMKKKGLYACMHHPKMKSDKAGKCPECGMELTMMNDKMKNTDMMKKDEMKKK